jgi:uncharacterized protein YqeY
MIDIDTQIKTAMLSKSAVRLQVLRQLKTTIAGVVTAKGRNGKPLSDDEFLSLVRKQIAQRDDSISAYSKAGVREKADAEQAEKDILNTFLPASLSDAEIDAIVTQAISNVGAVSRKDMGKAILRAKELSGGAADPRVISQLVAAKLQ